MLTITRSRSSLSNSSHVVGQTRAATSERPGTSGIRQSCCASAARSSASAPMESWRIDFERLGRPPAGNAQEGPARRAADGFVLQRDEPGEGGQRRGVADLPEQGEGADHQPVVGFVQQILAVGVEDAQQQGSAIGAARHDAIDQRGVDRRRGRPTKSSCSRRWGSSSRATASGSFRLSVGGADASPVEVQSASAPRGRSAASSCRAPRRRRPAAGRGGRGPAAGIPRARRGWPG